MVDRKNPSLGNFSEFIKRVCVQRKGKNDNNCFVFGFVMSYLS